MRESDSQHEAVSGEILGTITDTSADELVPSESATLENSAIEVTDVESSPIEEASLFKETEATETASTEALIETDEPQQHFQDIPAEEDKKARRSRTLLIVVIIVLVLALLGLGFLGYTMVFGNLGGQSNTPDISDTQIEAEVTDNSPTSETGSVVTTMPNLAGLFGMTTDEAQTHLGSSYVITKNEPVTNSSNPDEKQLVVFSYQAAGSSGATNSLAVPNVYLSLNADGRVVSVYFMSSLEALGYTGTSFSTLIATQDMMFNTLRAAGVTPANDYAFPTLSSSDYTVYVDPAADAKRIAKEEYTFSGATNAGSAPTSWECRLSYDYGAAGVAQGAGANPSQRTIIISLR